jgi:outer membrane protein TolC
LPPTDDRQIIPVSAPAKDRLEPNWGALVELAEVRRPDIIQAKLIVEEDKQRLLQAENQSLPQFNAVGTVQLNGLNGSQPNGDALGTRAGQFMNTTVGVNFSVPLGVRQARALARQQALAINRDAANVDQALHGALYDLTLTVRNLASNYEQYLAYKETRAAALDNLLVQIEQFRARRNIYLNVLQALNDWGNAVSSEALALLTYNIALATLERQTGTILETHGLVFYEEWFGATSPLGIPCHKASYPSAILPTGSPHRYPPTAEPAENSFDLRKPDPRDPKPMERLPPPSPYRPGP